jgi:hypothetical protein
MSTPPWLRPGLRCIWHADDGEEHVASVCSISKKSVTLQLGTGDGTDLVVVPRYQLLNYVKPLANKSSANTKIGLHNYAEGISASSTVFDVAAVVRDGHAELLYPGCVVSVLTEPPLPEGFMQIKEFRVNKETKEREAFGRWLYTTYEALKGLPGRPSSSSSDSPILFLSDEEATISLDSIQEVVSVKTQALYRAGLDDYMVKVLLTLCLTCAIGKLTIDANLQNHWNDTTKIVTPLSVCVAEEMLWHKRMRCVQLATSRACRNVTDKLPCSDPNLLNQHSYQFSLECKEYMHHVYGSRGARLSPSSVGKELHLCCTYPQLLAFEEDTLKSATVEWFQETVKRKKEWVPYITLRLSTDQLDDEMYADASLLHLCDN